MCETPQEVTAKAKTRRRKKIRKTREKKECYRN